jgi:hypothetical protein
MNCEPGEKKTGLPQFKIITWPLPGETEVKSYKIL